MLKRFSIQYQVALIQLFQPLLHLDKHYKASHLYLQNLLIKHARIGLALLIQYRNAYTFHYQSPIQLFCIVHICDALVKYDTAGVSTPDTVRFCLESLQESKVGFPMAGPLQKMFRLALAGYNIPLADDLERLIGPSSYYGPDELLDACTRPTYQQPIAQLLPNFDPSLAQDFMDAWQKLYDERSEDNKPADVSESDKQKSMQINSLLNN